MKSLPRPGPPRLPSQAPPGSGFAQCHPTETRPPRRVLGFNHSGGRCLAVVGRVDFELPLIHIQIPNLGLVPRPSETPMRSHGGSHSAGPIMICIRRHE
eukprot:3239182-Rhodomonas_salina.3